jgi:hypothetical protein
MDAILFHRNPTTAREVERILRLPDDSWTEVHVAFGNDEPATVTVTLLVTGEQLVELAILAATSPRTNG